MSTPLDQAETSAEIVQTEVTSPETEIPSEAKATTEEFTISGDALVAKVKELIHQGNIRRIILKSEEHTLIEIPLTVGVVGGVLSATLFPVVAAVGVIGAMLTHLTIVIEKKE